MPLVPPFQASLAAGNLGDVRVVVIVTGRSCLLSLATRSRLPERSASDRLHDRAYRMHAPAGAAWSPKSLRWRR